MANYIPTKPYTGSLPTGTVKKGSKGTNVKRVQTFLNWCINAGLKVDGICGSKTTEAIKKYQKQYKLKVDGIFGSQSRNKAKTIINDISKSTKPAPTPTTDPMQPWFDAMVTQFNWSKKQEYKFVSPTVESSKKYGTCITFVAVSLQRLGLLPSGGYFYFHPKHLRISGSSQSYVKKHTEIFALSYPNKTVTQLWKEGKIKVGDICGFGNPNYHTMVFMGMNSKGQPMWNSMGHSKKLKGYYSSYASRKVNMLVHLKKVKV